MSIYYVLYSDRNGNSIAYWGLVVDEFESTHGYFTYRDDIGYLLDVFLHMFLQSIGYLDRTSVYEPIDKAGF